MPPAAIRAMTSYRPSRKGRAPGMLMFASKAEVSSEHTAYDVVFCSRSARTDNSLASSGGLVAGAELLGAILLGLVPRTGHRARVSVHRLLHVSWAAPVGASRFVGSQSLQGHDTERTRTCVCRGDFLAAPAETAVATIPSAPRRSDGYQRWSGLRH